MRGVWGDMKERMGEGTWEGMAKGKGTGHQGVRGYKGGMAGAVWRYGLRWVCEVGSNCVWLLHPLKEEDITTPVAWEILEAPCVLTAWDPTLVPALFLALARLLNDCGCW